jgi:hypothetical protein
MLNPPPGPKNPPAPDPVLGPFSFVDSGSGRAARQREAEIMRKQTKSNVVIMGFIFVSKGRVDDEEYLRKYSVRSGR